VAKSTSPAIDVQGLSLCYRVARERVKSIKEFAIRRLKGELEVKPFWALRDVSFQVEPGEVFGIIGRNGAGKTTLLKVIARILRPTDGRVVVRGLVAPLLGLGAGFNEEMSGRENIFLSGATLGYSYRDMQSRFDRIVAFAGLEDFLETPLRAYSTGMRARLGFAIATDVEPDVLLLDEIMAVGDEDFRRRCNTRIEEFRDHGATVVLVSHGLKMVGEICQRALLLDRGTPQSLGPANDVINLYYRRLKKPG
jgi:ABC-2 type transport system ATP-binding protein/lipopolysaccharide transport system ATP-binding protein